VPWVEKQFPILSNTKQNNNINTTDEWRRKTDIQFGWIEKSTGKRRIIEINENIRSTIKTGRRPKT